MSATIPAPSVRDKIVADAQSLPDLISTAQQLDPAMANLLLGKATSAAKTQIGALATGAVVLIAGHFGFGWSEATDELIGGGFTLVAGLLIHWIQVRMSGLSATAPAPVAATTGESTHA